MSLLLLQIVRVNTLGLWVSGAAVRKAIRKIRKNVIIIIAGEYRKSGRVSAVIGYIWGIRNTKGLEMIFWSLNCVSTKSVKGKRYEALLTAKAAKAK